VHREIKKNLATTNVCRPLTWIGSGRVGEGAKQELSGQMSAGEQSQFRRCEASGFRRALVKAQAGPFGKWRSLMSQNEDSRKSLALDLHAADSGRSTE
jgi:hypothetical protein